MAHACAGVPKVAKGRFGVTTTPESATFLLRKNTSEEDDRRLATVAYSHTGLWQLDVGHGQHHCGTRAQRSDPYIETLRCYKFTNGKSLGSNAAAIPGIAISNAYFSERNIGRSRFVLGRICTTTAIILSASHSISGITETTFVCHSPRRTSPLSHSSFRVLFTRSDRHCPLRVDQTRVPRDWIRIPSKSS